MKNASTLGYSNTGVAVPTHAPHSSLPFTGLDAGITLAVGVMLVTLGLTLRRWSGTLLS